MDISDFLRISGKVFNKILFKKKFKAEIEATKKSYLIFKTKKFNQCIKKMKLPFF